MIEFLLAVPGRTKKLVDRLTQARADKLDFLDVAVSGRAAAATAVSNADYTAARAAKLDSVILTSVLASSIQTGYTNSLPNASSGEDNYYTDVAISAVVIAKSLVLCMSIEAGHVMSGRLTSTTNLRISGSISARGRWYVIEFK